MVQTQLIKCVSYAMVTLSGWQGCLVCSDLFQGAQMGVSSAWPPWGNASMSLARIPTGQIWPLGTKNEQMFSTLSERCYFPINLLELLISEVLCARWFLGVICQLSSPLPDSEHFKMPMDFSDCQLDFQMWTLVCVARQLDKACVSNITDYSWSMGALFKTRKKPLLPMKLGEK